MTAREQRERVNQLIKIITDAGSGLGEIQEATNELKEIAHSGGHLTDCSCLQSFSFDCDCGMVSAAIELSK